MGRGLHLKSLGVLEGALVIVGSKLMLGDEEGAIEVEGACDEVGTVLGANSWKNLSSIWTVIFIPSAAL